MADNLVHPYNRRQVLTIDDLPDDVLLEIFDFCVGGYQDLKFIKATFIYQDTRRKIESWQSLVHVCRRWRGLVFGSPRRLNLQVCYEAQKPARKALDVWPALPIIIKGRVNGMSAHDVIAVLEHSDRICQINLDFFIHSLIEKIGAEMQVPFPELTALCMSIGYRSNGLVLPDSFLGGSAPRLQYFYLDSIPFPGLPKLLLSATHLVDLRLLKIPHSGYISPEAMVTCLSMLTRLETLRLEFFVSLKSYLDLKSRRPSPPTRSVLPTLTFFSFKGVNEYLEEFVARIDAPQLYRLSMVFFNRNNLKAPELKQFIGRTRTLGAYDEAHLIFFKSEVLIRLRQSHIDRMVEVKLLWRGSDRRLSSVVQICTLSLRPLLTMENLYIDEMLDSPLDQDNIDNARWFDLLLPFTVVKNLYLSESCSPRIALALQEHTGGRTTEVLPALQNILLEGFQRSKPIPEGIAQFISARQLTNHPIAISVRDRVIEELDDW